jgi:endonuclease/exonuclease/phosphatase family metal-dependent hydrolase
MDYASYPLTVVEDIARLRRRIQASGIPEKRTDKNLLIGTWNVRAFGDVFPQWGENPASPKRNYRAMASIAEIARCLDVIAIQEVKRDTRGIRLLQNWLGPAWGLILSDVTAGTQGNDERLSFLYDQRRVRPSGLTGEIVLPPTPQGNPVVQFSRTPYIVGFESSQERFVLLTAHIKYGSIPEDRIDEIRSLADYIAREIRDRAMDAFSEEANLIVLGDFNIDERGDNPLFQAFRSTGLTVPTQLEKLQTTYGSKAKYYDQIGWFMGAMNLLFQDAGVVDFAGALFPEINLRSMSFRVSDHFPLWAAFNIDRSTAKMAHTLGVDPGMPDPLSSVPEINPPD